MTKGSGIGNSNGSTLIETVVAPSIAAVLAMFISGFIHPQMKLYYNLDRISQAKAMCDEAYRGLEEKLRYGYVFFCDHQGTGIIFYHMRNRQETPDLEGGGSYHEELLPVEDWPSVSAEEPDVTRMDGMELKLDFSGTENTRTRVSIKMRKGGGVVYEQGVVAGSVHGYATNGEGRTRWTGEEQEESIMDIPGKAT